MKSPPDQNMNPPQPTGESDFIHELADRISVSPYLMGKAIKRDVDSLWGQSYADFIVAMIRSIPHHSESDAYKDCMATVRQTWHNLAHEEARILFNQYGKDAMEMLDN